VITGPFGRTVGLELDADGWLEQVTDEEANSWTLTYDENGTGLLTTLVDPNGPSLLESNDGIHTFTYHADGKLTLDEGLVGLATELLRPERAYNGWRSVWTESGEGRNEL